MKLKKVDKDPFSNGEEYRTWTHFNCSKCIKSSEPRDSGDGLVYYINQREDGMPKCSIQRDIITRMFCNDPVKEETISICENFILNYTLCTYLKTQRKNKRRLKVIENQTEMFK